MLEWLNCSALPCYVCVWCACTACFSLDLKFLLEDPGVPRKAQVLFRGNMAGGVTMHAL